MFGTFWILQTRLVGRCNGEDKDQKLWLIDVDATRVPIIRLACLGYSMLIDREIPSPIIKVIFVALPASEAVPTWLLTMDMTFLQVPVQLPFKNRHSQGRDGGFIYPMEQNWFLKFPGVQNMGV